MKLTNTTDEPITVLEVTIKPGKTAELTDVQAMSPAVQKAIRQGRLVAS